MGKQSPLTPKQKKQTKHYIRQFFNKHYNAIGKSKHEVNEDMIRGVVTFNHHLETTFRIMKTLNIRNIDNINSRRANQWLKSRKDKVCKKTLQNEKKVLERILAINKPGAKLKLPGGMKDRVWVNRAYQDKAILKVIERQHKRTQLSTKLCYLSGLRTKELYTLRRLDEMTPSVQRAWRDDLFRGLEGEKYVVTGKGGLLRAVMIPTHLAKELESRRLDTPKEIKDRKVKILTHYDVSGGKAFSNSFSKLSKKVLGYSYGAHGLRYSYAQSRMELNTPGLSYEENKHIVSQELGHFRPDITDHYLTPELAK
ncbi:integrase domain-containing protein [Vibrio echinoideorum]|uniref:integrase domain-containing protein n=1 Tax=Vibrio echinoideorum TaxID=2100116 RepID=UPI0035530551